MTKQELNEKMLRLQRGDESAFEEIYNETRRGLFAFILSMCRNYQTAEDMMQTTYIRLRTSIASYMSGDNAYAWLYTIAKNATLNEINRARREMVTDEIADNPRAGTYHIDEEMSPVTSLMNKVLDDTERQIVTLHAISGFKHKEIALMLDKPLGSVLWTYNNALSKLKRALQREDDHET